MKNRKTVFLWEGDAEGEKVEAAIKRNEENLAGKKSKITPEWTQSILGILNQYIKDWQAEFRGCRSVMPKEQSEIIKRINRHALLIIRDIKVLGLPTHSIKYFVDDEVLVRHSDLLRASDFELDLEGIDEQLKEYMQFFLWNLPISDVRIDMLLKKLTDSNRLHEIADKLLLKKVNADQPEVTYIIRKLAMFFQNRYGKTLATTIENICAAIYPDAKLDNNKVRNKLRNFDLT